jgi:hypothetical protein
VQMLARQPINLGCGADAELTTDDMKNGNPRFRHEPRLSPMTRLIDGHRWCNPSLDSSVTYVVNSHTLGSTPKNRPGPCGWPVTKWPARRPVEVPHRLRCGDPRRVSAAVDPDDGVTDDAATARRSFPRLAPALPRPPKISRGPYRRVAYFSHTGWKFSAALSLLIARPTEKRPQRVAR